MLITLSLGLLILRLAAGLIVAVHGVDIIGLLTSRQAAAAPLSDMSSAS